MASRPLDVHREAGTTGAGSVTLISTPVACWRANYPCTLMHLGVAVRLASEETALPFEAWVRHSTDLRHFAPWTEMTPSREEFYGWAATGDDARQFLDGPAISRAARLAVPEGDATRFELARAEWLTTDPIWEYNRDGLCRWLAAHDPDFFSDTVPIIGYVQIRLRLPIDPARLSDVRVSMVAARLEGSGWWSDDEEEMAVVRSLGHPWDFRLDEYAPLPFAGLLFR